MCSCIRLGQSNRYWKNNRSFDHLQGELDILSFQKKKHINGPWKPEARNRFRPSLPATLMMIRSKMNELAWRHHFPILNFLDLKADNSVVSGPISSDILCMSSLPASIKGSNQKQPKKGGDIIFPIISQWRLSVAMETRVLIQSAPKPYAAVPHPNDATPKI